MKEELHHPRSEVQLSQDSSQIDYVILEEGRVDELTAHINPADEDRENRTVRVTMTADEEDVADQLAVEIPAGSIASLAARRAALEINTPEGTISLDYDNVVEIEAAGIDLYLRIIPALTALAAEANDLNEADYTAESWAALQAAHRLLLLLKF